MRFATLLAAGAMLSACSGALAPLPSGQAPGFVDGIERYNSSTPIKHVVIIVQENRSFNDLFYGFPGADTAKYGRDSKGDKIELRPISLKTSWDIEHDLNGFFAACNGTGRLNGTDCQMNGFDNQYWGCGHGSSQPRCPHNNPPYSYVPQAETKPYFYLGRHYVLADQMFASNLDASSFISHQYIIAGQASRAVNFPDNYWGCPGIRYFGYDEISTLTNTRQYGPNISMCWNNDTIGHELDKKGLSWAYYTSAVNGDGGIWSAYQNIKPIYEGPDWKKDVFTPQTRFFTDVTAGKLRDVSWITPTCENSDHAGCNSNTGPSWVASLVNAVGNSKYWDSTAMFIFWDDYGGWYDPAPPVHLDYDGLGLRIPLLVVSAYAKDGFVDHTPYEHGSILRFVEDTFGLPQMAPSDRRANSPATAFAFNKPARKFETVPSVHGINYFMHQKPDYRNPDPG